MEEQVIGILRQAEWGEQITGEICRAHGVSEQSFIASARSIAGERWAGETRSLPYINAYKIDKSVLISV